MSNTEERMYFKCRKGGFTQYEGVMSSSKEAQSIEIDKKKGRVVVIFADSDIEDERHVYLYYSTVQTSDKGFSITDEGDSWMTYKEYKELLAAEEAAADNTEQEEAST